MAEQANIVGPEAVLSYPTLFQARSAKPTKDRPNPKPMFSVTALYTPAAMASPLGVALRAAVMQAAVDKWGKDAVATMLRENTLKLPFRRDLSRKEYDSAVFETFVSSSSGEDYPPSVVSNVRGADGKRLPIRDKREIYPGVRAHVSYSTRTFGGPGTQYDAGVSLDLRGVIKVGDGPRLAGSSSDPDADFAGIPDGKPASVENDPELNDFLK